MWIDTHCHLDATEFGGQHLEQADAAAAQGVGMIVLPAVAVDNFATVSALAAQRANLCYALGIHPLYVAQSADDDLERLREAIVQALPDPRFVAVGEIGLDFFIPELQQGPLRQRQEHFYQAQLKLAREFDLPVLLHVRRSQDIILKYLRRISVPGGIAHAFNGSFQQAGHFVELGFKLGFGGAMTFPRSLQIRRLAAQLPLDAIVLETDAPDISPAWLHPAPNHPDQIPRIGEVLAGLREIPLTQLAQLAQATSANAQAVLPRLTRS
ncbi:TatD DNase family protein [Herbaspirillum sp. Sphag1AN]|uniref:TatD family hydrolase n=1 Tax=unclassified Herbaspirillum TaxID=2624150 RepID=UPI001613FC2D|nr:MULTISPECIES: TatD family hydrolase [unclassified Herbaspirillum]MBB3210785.1 TatD DNase family protein [Herbaspirillum sp. Sphag1AN]MBB3244415.1 TatD DNase family protein [Herbaspirillum sp. Sphag64]